MATITKNVDNKTVYLAPIEIEDKGQFETLNITFEDCNVWYLGSETIIVYLTPANAETAAFLTAEINTKHSHGFRSVRCKIPGKRKPLITCPDTNSCAHCPYGRKPEKRDPNKLSLNQLIDDGYDPGVQGDLTAETAIANVGWTDILNWFEARNPVYRTILMMRNDGFSVTDIAARIGKSEQRVYQLIRELKKLYPAWKCEQD